MKKNIILICFLCSSLLGCQKDEPQSKEETNVKMLTSKVWKITSVTVDNVSVSDFGGMTLKFTTTSFTAVNGNVVWPTNDTWIFADASATSLIRGDGAVVTIDELSSTVLKLSLTWNKDTYAGGRSNSVKGNYKFLFH